MPENKNQHFVPRFYLKNFSLQSQRERIRVFNISSCKFINSANLYDQASKNYFYGRDLKIENALKPLETESAKIINSIIDKQTLPQADSREHQMLLMFIITLLGRTVYAAEMIDEVVEKYKETVTSIDANALLESERNIDLTLTDAVQESLRIAVLYFPLVRDICWKLIINETEQPFITSDHPVALYNQFLEPRKTYGSNVGLASKGLQIFLPLSPKFTLNLFDKDVYRVGTRNKPCVSTDLPADITALNLLQLINANKNIYFNEDYSEKQVQELLILANRYRRQTKVNWDKYPKRVENQNKKILLHLYGSDVKCSLKLSFISLLKKAKSYLLEQNVCHVRDDQLCRLHERFLKLVDEEMYAPGDFYEFVNDCKMLPLNH
ncbi:hypothetical protein BCD64_06185 [Nostoc sp. MBR 210]|nr:hypothetical protein BCD64_06185 [Nostoc sp. MBR 210]